MKRHLFAAALLAGSTFSLPAAAQGFECTGSMASLAVAAVDTVVSMLGGGRASQLAQGLQIKEAIIANFCAASMNDQLLEINEYERRNIANGTANGITGINGMIRRTEPWLNQGGFLMGETAIQQQVSRIYPEMFPLLTAEDLIGVNGEFRQRERASYLAAVALQNLAAQEQGRALARARDHAAAGRAGEGMRSELQAMNAIGGEQIVALNGLTAATLGSQRAAQESRLRDEAKVAASNASAEEFMSNLSVCTNCNISRPFLGN